MFVCKFEKLSDKQTTFDTDTNGNYPFVGKVLAGIATNSIYNGTMFLREELSTDKMYFCQNVKTVSEKNGETYNNVEILSVVDSMEFISLRKTLGEGRLNLPDNDDSPE